MTRKTLLTLSLSLAVAMGMLITLATGLSLAKTPDPVSTSKGESTKVTVEYTLLTGGGTGQLVFVGVGGEIDGMVNPALMVNPGDVVKITLINGDGMLHDVSIDEFNVATDQFAELDQQDSIMFTADQIGEFVYYCSVPGHRQAGMWGKLIVGEPAAQGATGADIVRDPADVPPAVAEREPQTVRVELVAEEVVGQVGADGDTDFAELALEVGQVLAQCGVEQLGVDGAHDDPCRQRAARCARQDLGKVDDHLGRRKVDEGHVGVDGLQLLRQVNADPCRLGGLGRITVGCILGHVGSGNGAAGLLERPVAIGAV